MSGYTQNDVHTILMASDRLNAMKQEIQRVFGIVNGFVTGQIVGMTTIGDVPLASLVDHMVYLKTNWSTKSLAADVWNLAAPSGHQYSFCIHWSDGKYVTQHIPTGYVRPVYETLPQILDMLCSYFPQLREDLENLVRYSGIQK